MGNIRPRLIIFASGTAEGGGSGAARLVMATREGILWANTIAFVSNHEHGGVAKHAAALHIPFIYFPKPWTAEAYQEVFRRKNAEWTALSGWLKPVIGLDSRTTFNIHPGPLPQFGGKGMFGHHVHEAVLAAFKRGEITHSAVSMHFVTEKYDDGPVFFRYPVPIMPDDTPETLGKRVNRYEHEWQLKITSLVVHRRIYWDGEDPDSLTVPANYNYL